MDKDIYFMPLGGGQKVGASCYYLKLGESNLILDAGKGMEDGVIYNPDFYTLLTSPFLQSMNQIHQIYISHAHLDHVGYLLELMAGMSEPKVYMTELTALLAEYQLYDKNFIYGAENREERRLAAQSLLEKVKKVNYLKPYEFSNYTVTFYPAGHIPGASMMLFEFGKKKILYTGDYSLDKTALTGGCMLPKDQDIDVLIMCGLHAKHPDYVKKADGLYKTVHYAWKTVKQTGKSAVCHVFQLSKGIEFVKTLAEKNDGTIPVYLDDRLMGVVQKLERLSVPVLDRNIRPLPEVLPMQPHIIVTGDRGVQYDSSYQHVNVNFSLHEDFEDMRKFIKQINPKTAVMVHCGKENSLFDDTIEQLVMRDGECRTQFIFAEEKEIYRL